MGVCSSKDADKQVLLCGLDESGKTTLLYTEYGMHPEEFHTEPTLGFNFETVSVQRQKVGVFDVGGQDAVRYLWPTFYRKIQFDGLIFIIDALDDKRFFEAKQEFHKLVNEEELRNVVFCVLYNYKDFDEEEEEEIGREAEIKKERETEKQKRQNMFKKLVTKAGSGLVGSPKEMMSLKDGKDSAEMERLKEREVLKKTLDAMLGIDELHTFQVRRSFLFNILDPKDKPMKDDMYEWFIGRLRSVNE